MKKYILLVVIGLYTMASFAHRTETSTILLVEKEGGTWVLQVSASLTAFQHEIQTHFSETPYQTPEEFREMVLKHIKNNLVLAINGMPIDLSIGEVLLGHETKVAFKVFGIPTEIETVQVQNTTFKDIYKNESRLILMKKGFNKEGFVLNEANNHSLNIVTKGNMFQEVAVEKSNASMSYLGWIGTAIFLLFITLIAIPFVFKPERITLKSV